jgi:hypothetical protein
MPTQPAGQGKPFFGTKVSKPGVPVGRATDKQLIFKDDFNTKTWYDNTNVRMIEGLLPDGSYGMIASKPGFDATTAAPSQIAFTSALGSLVVAYSTNETVTLLNSGVPTPSSTTHTFTGSFGSLGLVFVTGQCITSLGDTSVISNLNGSPDAFGSSGGQAGGRPTGTNTFSVTYLGLGSGASATSITYTVRINYMILTS